MVQSASPTRPTLPILLVVSRFVDRLSQSGALEPERKDDMIDFSDEKHEEILRFIDSLDERVFIEATRNTCKPRIFLNPSEVISCLVSHGATHTCSTNESHQWLWHLKRVTACVPQQRHFERNAV